MKCLVNCLKLVKKGKSNFLSSKLVEKQFITEVSPHLFMLCFKLYHLVMMPLPLCCVSCAYPSHTSNNSTLHAGGHISNNSSLHAGAAASHSQVRSPTTAACMQVQLPLTPARLEKLCYSDLNSTEAERNAVVNSLLQALHQLESSVDMDSEVRKVIEGGGGDWMGQYMVKREFSEGSFHVFGIVVPDLRSSHASRDQKAHPNCREGVCQNNITSPSSEACDDASDGGGSMDNSPQAHQPVDSSDAAFSSGSAGAEAEDEAGDAGRHATNSDADLGIVGAASDKVTCVGKEWPISKAVAVMHKAQTLIWPLVPHRIAQLRPVAKLLGRSSHISSSSSGGGGCNRSSDTMHQAPFCPNVDSQIVSGTSDLSQAKPANEATCFSTVPERVTDNQASAMEASMKVDSKPHSRPDLLPNLQTGDAVTSDILIPTEHSSSAEAKQDHVGMPHGSHGSEYAFADWKLPVELVSLLEVTADRILKESCGEGWLIQPRIADMTRLEYRVYMLSGAQAVSELCDVCVQVLSSCHTVDGKQAQVLPCPLHQN